MNSECHAFRVRLEERLANGALEHDVGDLHWHEHVLGCEDCRELLRAEEALEMLLATLPAPRLPAHLASRVLARLRGAHDDALDALLEWDVVDPPEGLAQRVLAGVDGARLDRRLDALLDEAGAVEPPDGLASRVLAGLEDARAESVRARALRSRMRSVPGWTRAAAALLVGLSVFALWKLGAVNPREGQAPNVALVEPAASEPDDELLAALDVLENWELLHLADGDDPHIGAFHGFDESDAALLALLDDEDLLATFEGEAR